MQFRSRLPMDFKKRQRHDGLPGRTHDGTVDARTAVDAQVVTA
jgi:hypothetical protein